MKTFTVRLTTMDQPMSQKAEGSKAQEKWICRIRHNRVWKGKSLSNTVDGPFIKRMRMGEGKEHELLVEHGVLKQYAQVIK